MGLFNLFKTADINSGIEEYKLVENAVLLDVREPHEYNGGHIDGSINLPLQKIDQITALIPNKSTPVYVHCLSGARSGKAVSSLKSMGYKKAVNIGGIGSYRGKVIK